MDLQFNNGFPFISIDFCLRYFFPFLSFSSPTSSFFSFPKTWSYLYLSLVGLELTEICLPLLQASVKSVCTVLSHMFLPSVFYLQIKNLIPVSHSIIKLYSSCYSLKHTLRFTITIHINKGKFSSKNLSFLYNFIF